MKSPLVTASELAAHPEWRLIDCRHDLKDVTAGWSAYCAGHIPGAIFLHLDKDLSAPRNGRNGRHPLADPTVFATHLGHQGIDHASTVIAYDDHGGIYAARLWWMLRWLGHERVAVLDGGLAAWIADGGQVEAQTRSWPATQYIGTPARHHWLDVSQIKRDFVEAAAPTRGVLLDARSADRFAGENEPLDPVGGHIPGASNRYFGLNLDPQTKRFRNANDLRQEFLELLGPHAADQVIHQCGSGVTACHNLLAMEYAGLSGSRLYPGSWSEWCADPDRPVATGPT